ncbi:hypothetical protein B0H10DRAFT_1944495 [Mycena sp. CBHHK59/15]|nr:hypothetical protein B0H10DRAFT_1944495 [Mycena sp. CBHHK59/15]
MSAGNFRLGHVATRSTTCPLFFKFFMHQESGGWSADVKMGVLLNVLFDSMSPTSSHLESIKKSKAALARAARLKVMVVSLSDPDSLDSDNCHWDGTEGNKLPQLFETFNHHNIVYDQSGDAKTDLSHRTTSNSDEASIMTAYQAITEYKSEKNWKEAEKKLNGPYTGNSECLQWRNDKKLRDKEEEDKISRTSAAATSFKSMFVVLPQTLPSNPSIAPVPVAVQATTPQDTTLPTPFIATPPKCVCHLSSCR